MKPLILIAFANDQNEGLNLVSERDTILNIFNDSSKIEVKVLENANSTYIYNTITDPEIKDRIIIFHYGGHANSRNIELLDGQARTLGLAKALKRLPNLQLVFLNGCDTFDQSAILHREGISAVVTTLKPVN